jgi:1,5-anhydro-D-fructose reductase (1,5-anhydro-D-mannitol-forming)
MSTQRPLRPPVRWGIIGCGNVTEVKSGPGFQKATDSSLVAVMRRDAEAAADYARRHGVPRWYAEADALVDDPDVDAVYIASPPGSHLEHALRACRAGKPVYVEKPMARNYTEAVTMRDAFAAAGVPLFAAYYRRALPRFLETRALIESGALGRVSSVACAFYGPRHLAVDPAALPWRLDARESGGGLAMDLASHAVDIIDFLLGPLSDVRGSAANVASPHDVEDVLTVSFRAGDTPGIAVWNFASSQTQDILMITGTVGRVQLSVFGDEPLRVWRGDQVTEVSRPNPQHVQQPLIQSVVDDLLGRGRCASTGESGARASRVLDQALDGYYGGRGDPFWERPGTWPGRRSWEAQSRQ